jgi:hypothetical protein
METGGSLPRSQQPANGPYPKPDYPVHITASNFSKIYFIIIFSPHICIPSGFFPSGFPQKALSQFLFSLEVM